jgi:hypothetical protein
VSKCFQPSGVVDCVVTVTAVSLCVAFDRAHTCVSYLRCVCSDKQAREARGVLAYIFQHPAQSDGAEEVGYCEGARVWL